MFDRGAKVPIECPKCHNKFEETIARLEKDPQVTCPSCRITFQIKADVLRNELSKAQRSAGEFGRNFSKIKI